MDCLKCASSVRWNDHGHLTRDVLFAILEDRPKAGLDVAVSALLNNQTDIADWFSMAVPNNRKKVFKKVKSLLDQHIYQARN